MSLFFACTTTWLTAELHAVRKHGSFAQGFRSELGEFFVYLLPFLLWCLNIGERKMSDELNWC